jgi:hypothetical protein
MAFFWGKITIELRNYYSEFVRFFMTTTFLPTTIGTKIKIILISIFCLLFLFTATFSKTFAAQSRFTLGVSAPPDNDGLNKWIPESKIPFDHAYQYLVGGVNTNTGWQSWGANSNFPLDYANKSAALGITPVFTYYQLLQSNGNCNSCDEAQKDLSNINNKDLMKKYYEDFTILMKKLGTNNFGKNSIVHIEPDLSGFAQQATNSQSKCFGFCIDSWGGPKSLKASVSDTGNADLKNLPNNYNGYNLALLKLRDIHAPNVKLAIHVSNWASGKDISSDKSSINEWSLGWKVGDFARNSEKNETGESITKYDYIFNDVADRDAGFYDKVYGDNSKWWDTKNKLFPNFSRWENYINMINQINNKPIIIWQIPLGNQVARAENNSWGHYQDNKLQYFFEHIPELQNNGITGLLFGSGNAGSTYHYDNNKNGATNPSPICNTDGNSDKVSICTSLLSTDNDDDGGYFRSKSKIFYGMR